MASKDSFVAQQQARAENLVASRLLICQVDHIDAANKLAYLIRPGQVVADGQGYLGGYGVVAGLTVGFTVKITVSGHDYTDAHTLTLRPPLAQGDQVLAVETGGTLFVVDRVDK